MTSNFDRWEKDPFFSAAEEVQESADRMESRYRRWLHERKNASESVVSSEELRRELQTALGTAKWQLEEFERAVQLSYHGCSADDMRSRHHQFVLAIKSQISKIENSLWDSVVAEGKTMLPWVRLDEGERDELALFLIGSTTDGDVAANGTGKDEEGQDLGLVMEEGKLDSVEDLRHSVEEMSHSVELGLHEQREERMIGHRRTASASVGLDAWRIAVADDDTQHLRVSFDGRTGLPFPKIVSFSDFNKTMESASQLNWSKNCFKKWKGRDCHQASDIEPLQSDQLSQGINACYERTKSCLDSFDESYDKQLYGWLGAVHRLLQRSLYQFHYIRTVQMTFWIVLIICLIGFCFRRWLS